MTIKHKDAISVSSTSSSVGSSSKPNRVEVNPGYHKQLEDMRRYCSKINIF
jgi:hypothetical protein